MTVKKFDRRWIFLAMGLIVLVFLKFPIEFEYSPSVQTLGFYQALEDLSPGSTVYLAVDYGPSSQAEILPMHEGVVYHLLKKDVKLIAGSLWDTAPPMSDIVFNRIQAQLAEEGIHKEYGVDFVNLGYKAGQDVAMVKIATSIPETFPKDYRRTPIQQLPIMAGIENFDQIALICNMSGGFPGVREWLQQVQKRFDVRLVAGVTAVMSPDLYSFHQSKQIEGFLGGLVGAAEYEHLLNRPGEGKGGMAVQSLVHVFLLLLIGVGNTLYFVQRRREKSKSAGREMNDV